MQKGTTTRRKNICLEIKSQVIQVLELSYMDFKMTISNILNKMLINKCFQNLLESMKTIYGNSTPEKYNNCN